MSLEKIDILIKFLKKLIHDQNGELIEDGDDVECMVVDAKLSTSILFLDQEAMLE